MRVLVIGTGDVGLATGVCMANPRHDVLCVGAYVEKVNASSLDRTRGDHLAQDLMDRGLIACTAIDVHDGTHRVPNGICNEGSMSMLKEGE